MCLIIHSTKMKKKKIDKFNRLVDKYSNKRECVKIYRNVTDGEANIYGVILAQSNEFLQLTENNEFKFNGELIIRKDHFDAIRCSKYEKKIREILVAENHLSNSKPIRTEVELLNWNGIFNSLKNKDIHVIIECEDLKKPTFTIGAINKVKKKSIEISNYDPSGKVDKKSTNIKFKNITLVRFKDAYSTTFRKYLR